ncbi:MAG: 3-hydroxyisobutyrate dehydrogenase-like beta-hydroxyacid dehydrogenase, partial [Alphaproteobacteria bacterium]
MAAKAIKSVAMIGLGKMGGPMTKYLVAKGFTVHGFDIAPKLMAAARKNGAKTGKSPADVAAKSDLIIVVVGFDSEVDTVLFGPKGVVSGARTGTTIAICSTVSPEYMRDLPSRMTRKGIDLVDAPLCRGEPAAEAGKLLVLGGGKASVFNRCKPAFAAFADAIHYLGVLGAGQVGKMVNNMVLWACISANYEGLKLGSALGVDEEKLRQALLVSSAQNWALETWLMQREMPWAEKDMSIVLHEADMARISL